MKELIIEQKAKAYDKALERAKKLIETSVAYDRFTIEKIFPELKESVDECIEKIKKDLISYLNNRQITSIAESSATEKWITWIKKQGESKPTIEMKSAEESLGIDSETYNKIVDECIYGEQTPTDQIKPMFKVGDWIISKYMHLVMQILNNDNRSYKTVETDGTERNDSYDFIERNFNLWTIQDAKNGDVLATDDGNIFVFDGRVKNSKYLFAYCGLTRHKFEFYDRRLPFTHDNIHPATKKQYDTLMKAMADTGYTFDFDKKKLKKIEQKPTDQIKPMFKVGDWVIFNNHESVYQVEKIENYRYFLRHYLGGLMSVHFDNELIRPWTIQDAKDGDVLITNSNIVFIFKYLDEGGTIAFRASCTENSGVYFPKIKEQLCDQDVHPATKEQRDLLFFKMNELGYVWDSKSKQLLSLKAELNDKQKFALIKNKR